MPATTGRAFRSGDANETPLAAVRGRAHGEDHVDLRRLKEDILPKVG
jgi:hypothetical protein